MERNHHGSVARGAITVTAPRTEVYRFWRNFENLTFMAHLESITIMDQDRSHWVASLPAGRTEEWDARLVRDIENEVISWEVVEGTGLLGGGEVVLKDAPGDKGTEVYVTLNYDVPGGGWAEGFLRLWKEHPAQILREDLRRFKWKLETGEIPTLAGQPSGVARERSRT